MVPPGPGPTRGYGLRDVHELEGQRGWQFESSPASGALLCFVQSCGRCAARHPTGAGYEAGSHEALHSLSSTVHCTHFCVRTTDFSLLSNVQALGASIAHRALDTRCRYYPMHMSFLMRGTCRLRGRRRPRRSPRSETFARPEEAVHLTFRMPACAQGKEAPAPRQSTHDRRTLPVPSAADPAVPT